MAVAASCEYRKLAVTNITGTETRKAWSWPHHQNPFKCHQHLSPFQDPRPCSSPACSLPNRPLPWGGSRQHQDTQRRSLSLPGDMAETSITLLLPYRGCRVGCVPWEGLSPAIAPCPHVPTHEGPHAGQKSRDPLTTRGKVEVPRALTPPFPQDRGHGECQPLTGGGHCHGPSHASASPRRQQHPPPTPARGGHMRDGWH